MVRPKKHLGQHFLTDKNIAGKIVNCLELPLDTVCEVGPGTGILTHFLLEKDYKKLFLIEIDGESVEYLKENFNRSNLTVLHADFLKTDLKRFVPSQAALIGNFPYNISSQIFFKLIESRNLFPETVGMIQKEVAERIIAPAGSKTYGILSVLLQAWFDIRYCFTVNETVFYPPPKVKSAVIRLVRNNKEKLGCDESLFLKIVKTGFNQRRKTLRNALKMLQLPLPDTDLLQKRAEQLSVDDFIRLTNLFKE